MSVYQKRLMEDFNLDPRNSEKLALTLEDKKKVVHYKNLQFYLKQGMRLKNCTERSRLN